jgi:hypothetical protein
MNFDTRVARKKGGTVILALGRFLVARKIYLVWSSEPFFITIQPYTLSAASSLPVTQSLVEPIIRTAIRDGDSVVLSLSKFLRDGDDFKRNPKREGTKSQAKKSI